jgi:hypothetical protein
VAAVNEGTVLPIAAEAAGPLTRAALQAEASARMGGLDDWGDDDFVEPLDRLTRALEEEAQLNVIGRWMTRRFLVRLLEVRLQLMAYVARDPGVRDEAIVRPVFVTGAPRSGTTILYELLAQDARLRAPEGWELLRPVPPPEGKIDPARVALADAELRLPQEIASGLVAIHEYSGRMPKECLSAMSLAFRSEEFVSRYDIPSYTDWLLVSDMTPAYEMHKLVLQVLQRRAPARRLVLKSPVHLHSLPVLFAAYPDTSVVVTHRDPLAVLGSVTSLLATLRWAHSDRVDVDAIAAYHAARYSADLDALVDLELPSGRVDHVRYADFVHDGPTVVKAVYNAIDLPYTDAVDRAVRDRLGERPAGEHYYSFDFASERPRFARYCAHFGIEAGQ